MIESVYGFEADNEELNLYNGQAVLDLAITYVLDDDDETAYTFPGYSSSFMYVYDSPERNYQIKSFTSQVTRNSNVQVLNLSASDCTFDNEGTFYYELGYVRSGYEIVLRYGSLYIS